LEAEKVPESLEGAIKISPKQQLNKPKGGKGKKGTGKKARSLKSKVSIIQKDAINDIIIPLATP